MVARESYQQQVEVGLPSGYLQAERIPFSAELGYEVLPWIDTPQELSVARCVVQGGIEFYLASAVGTHPNLVKAAEGLNEHQQRNVNNMMYSRLPGYVQNHHGPNIETLRKPATDFPVRVMKNQGGQRFYFATPELPFSDGSNHPVVLRLGACDKNRQELVLSVLSAERGSSQHKVRKA